MDNESEVIHQQMDETRSALQDKLETLEQQVKDTVQDATEAVSETVESVKDAVHETVGTVKDTVQDTVQSVKNTFDLPRQVEAHPWAMFLGAAAVGFIATRWLTRPASPAPAAIIPRTESISSPPSRNGGHEPGNGVAASPRQAATSQPASAPSKGSWFATHYSEELAKLKGLAVGTVGGLVRALLTSSVAPAMAEQIKDVVNGITVKMGGHLIEGPLLPSLVSDDDIANATSNKDRDSTFMRRPLATGPR